MHECISVCASACGCASGAGCVGARHSCVRERECMSARG